ncbi:MAG: hypothetical protein EZS28_004244 [Streblomastix strix]|uniref:Uncharacterized protein n=1 Tax=Streblomastix strix TaxID=222440 RepID=A0A5J4X184_9EUKA|nr:MAG: hypothetical protein EZS28_004244 [Streblomastix strix]
MLMEICKSQLNLQERKLNTRFDWQRCLSLTTEDTQHLRQFFRCCAKLHANIATVDKLGNYVNLHCLGEKKYLVKLWEDLLLSTIGKKFLELHVVRIELSTRVKEDCLTIFPSAQNAINSDGFVCTCLFKVYQTFESFQEKQIYAKDMIVDAT